MDSQQKISILVASDNNYAILLSALLKSIEFNHKTGESLEIYIIDDGISTRNKKRLQSQIDPNMSNIHWVKSSQVVPADLKIPIDKSAFPLTNYMRVFAPFAVPDSLDRIIYLDVDMIVLKDLSDLWHTNLQDKIFGAVIDFAEVFSCEWSGVPNYRELGFAPDTKYFNSGLMVIDLDKWRNEHVTHRVIQCMHENLDHVNLADQYGLNVVLAKDWLELDRRWNNYSIVDRKDPFIIHFLDIKPIYRSYRLSRDYQAEFYKYLRMTSWKNHRPQSDYRRIVRKIYNKSKKILSKIRIRSRNIKVS